MKNLMLFLGAMFLGVSTYGQDEMAFGHESGNGGDRIREVFLWKGHEVIDYLSTSTDGLYLVDYYNLNIPELTRTLDINRLVVTNQILTDDTGSDVESLYDRTTGILYLYKPSWLDLLNGAGISHTHILHEMCRMSSCNDDGYIISRHLQGKKVSDGYNLVTGFMADEGFSLLDEDYIIEVSYNEDSEILYESFLKKSETGQVYGKSRDLREEGHEVILETVLDKLPSGWRGKSDGTEVLATQAVENEGRHEVTVSFESSIEYTYTVSCFFERERDQNGDGQTVTVEVATCSPQKGDRFISARVTRQYGLRDVYLDARFREMENVINRNHIPEWSKGTNKITYQRDLGETLKDPKGLIIRERGELSIESLIISDPELFVLLYITKYDFPRIPENGLERPDENDHFGNPKFIAIPKHLQVDIGITPITYLATGEYMVSPHWGMMSIAGWATPKAKLKVLEAAGLNISVGVHVQPAVILTKGEEYTLDDLRMSTLSNTYVLAGRDDALSGFLTVEAGIGRHFLTGRSLSEKAEDLEEDELARQRSEADFYNDFRDRFSDWNGVIHLRFQTPLRDLRRMAASKGKHGDQGGLDLYVYGPNYWGASLGISVTPTWFGRGKKD